MREVKYICDSCGESLKEEVYVLKKESIQGNGIMGDNRTPFHLCEACFDILCSKLEIKSFEKFPNL